MLPICKHCDYGVNIWQKFAIGGSLRSPPKAIGHESSPVFDRLSFESHRTSEYRLGKSWRTAPSGGPELPSGCL